MDMDMSMGGMSMNGLPALLYFPKMYWAVVGTAIGIATMVNLSNFIIYRQRLSAARIGQLKPAKPKSLFWRGNATMTAIMREASNYSVFIPIKEHVFRMPTIGRTSLVLGNLVVLIVLCFYGFDVSDRWSREDIGYRTGFINVAQLPLIFLLSGKNNIVGFLTGVSYERLNWLHRWCSRCLLLTTTIHMGYFFADWAPYNYIGQQIKEDTLVWKGLAAWAVLVWLVFSSMTPIRGWCYEFFVIQHIISFAIFIGFVYIHTPAEVHIYIWIPVGLFFFDRVMRALRVLYANVALFHPKQRKEGQMSGFWACKAEFTPLPHDTTRITIRNPPISWTPGQHVFLSCHSVVPLQSHPFTISSIPEDGKMEFLVKAEKGGTKRFLRYAKKQNELPTSSDKPRMRSVVIEGPYGCLRPLRQFDSVTFLAGTTGATFTVPLLRDIVQGWRENASQSPSSESLSIFRTPKGAVTRHIRFVWVVKSRGQLGWFAEQLSALHADIQALQLQLKGITLDMTIYVTCDESFTTEHKSLLSTVTAPTKKPPPEPQRGAVEYLPQSSSTSPETEKPKTQEDIQELNSETNSVAKGNAAKSCGPNGTCCCKTTLDTEDTPASPPTCCCNASPSHRPTSVASSTPSSTSPPKSLLRPGISVLSGRPNCRNIIRRSLEQALGESAVVVCGPQGLVSDVKRSVVGLSDERGVHKGTGAQGVYLHTESFGY